MVQDYYIIVRATDDTVAFVNNRSKEFSLNKVEILKYLELNLLCIPQRIHYSKILQEISKRAVYFIA